MNSALDTSQPGLASAIRRTSSSGKRLRPALVFASTGNPEAPSEAAVRAAAAVEMMHWATLAHDDVMDDALARHGQPTINAAEGAGAAIVAGDLLIGLSFGLAAPLGPAVTLRLSETLTELCVGQNRESLQRWRVDLHEDDIIAVAAAKTGSLLGAAAQIGGLCAGLGAEQVAALARFGRAFGISLQILDDLLDVVSSADRLGKPVGADFSGGTLTVPGLAALQHHPELAGLLRPSLTITERRQAMEWLREPRVLTRTVELARAWAHTAASGLRAAAAGNRALLALAWWPDRYVESVLASKVEPAFTAALDGGAVGPDAAVAV